MAFILYLHTEFHRVCPLQLKLHFFNVTQCLGVEMDATVAAPELRYAWHPGHIAIFCKQFVVFAFSF